MADNKPFYDDKGNWNTTGAGRDNRYGYGETVAEKLAREAADPRKVLADQARIGQIGKWSPKS